MTSAETNRRRLTIVFALGSIVWSVGLIIFCYGNSGTNFQILAASGFRDLYDILRMMWPVSCILVLALLMCIRSAPQKLEPSILIFVAPLALSGATVAWGVHASFYNQSVGATYMSASAPLNLEAILFLHDVLVSAAIALALFAPGPKGRFLIALSVLELWIFLCSLGVAYGKMGYSL